MFFLYCKNSRQPFRLWETTTPSYTAKNKLQTSLYLQGTNMVGLGKVIGGTHTPILIQITYTISISQLRLWKTTPSCPPTLYLPCMLSDTSLLPCLSYLFVFSLQSGVVECQLQSCPRALSLKTIKIHILYVWCLVRRRCMFYYCMFVSSPVDAAFVCWLECVVWCTYIPDTVVVKLKSVKNIYFFFHIHKCRVFVLSSTTPSLLLVVRLSSVPIILHAMRRADRMQEGS